MTMFFGLLGRIALFAALGVPGFLLGKLCFWEKNVYAAISDILMYCAMPMLVLARLLETDVAALSPLGLALAFLFPFVSVGTLLSFSRLFFKKEGNAAGLYRFCAVFHNCGFLGIPLSQLLFPDLPAVTVYISVFNVSATFLLLTLGPHLLGGENAPVPWRRALLSPITFAIVLGVIFSLAGVGEKLPFLGTYAEFLAALTTPLSMLVLGAEFAHLTRAALRQNKDFWFTMLLKLGVSPLLTLLVLFPLMRLSLLDGTVASALLIATAVSSATSSPAMAEKFGQDGALATMLTVGSTILCIVTLPLWWLVYTSLF